MGTLSQSLKKFPLFHVFFAVTFLSTGVLVSAIQLVMTILIKTFSPKTYSRLNYYVTYILNSQIAFLGEWWSGSRCILYSDPDHIKKYMGKEPMLLIMNHSFEIDWNLGWIFCDRIGVLGQAKVFMKKALQYVPIMGWTWKMQDIIFVERNWEKDKISLARQLTTLSNYPVPYLLAIFPEGTRFTPAKHQASMEVATSKGLPTLKHLLLPRTRGFVATIGHLRKTMPAVYDVTLALDPKLGANHEPSMYTMLRGKSLIGHLLVRRIPMEDIPEDEVKVAEWLQELFRHKDKCLDNFYTTGDFNPKGDLKEYKTFEYVELPRKMYSVITTLTMTGIFILPLIYFVGTMIAFGGSIERTIAIVIIAASYRGLQKMVNLTRVAKASAYGTTK